MIKECINLLADDIEDVTNETIKFANCKLEDCFPAISQKICTIDGKEYYVSLTVKLKEVKDGRSYV